MSARTKKAAWPMTAVHTAYCPHCRAVTNLSVSVIPTIVTEPDGKEKIVSSRTYHCESCRSFVRSEENAKSEIGV